MSNTSEDRLWQVGDTECVMISCCAGAELQLRRAGDIVVRELYPMKSDLYERAADLKTACERGTLDPATP